MIRSEKKQLFARDIPYFFFIPNSQSIFDDFGVVATEAFDAPPIEYVKNQIAAMSPEDQKLQLFYIQQCFYAQKAGHVSPQVSNKTQFEHSPQCNFLDAARAIGENLIQHASETSTGTLSWMALELASGDRFRFQPLSSGLYGGVSGVCFFLAALGKVTQEKKWTEIALKNIQEMVERMEPRGLGISQGMTSLVYALQWIGEFAGEPALIDQAIDLMKKMKEDEIEKDQGYDILGGAAGTALVVLSLLEKRRDPDLLRLADRLGQHLLSSGQKNENGTLTWPKVKPLTGFSHGAAGFAFALSKLGATLNNPTYTLAANEALLYERKYFNKEEKNWPDFRQEPLSYAVGWCHGAPGICLSRLHLTADKETGAEIEAALQTTLNHLTSGIDQLCCGIAGRIAICQDAAEILGRPYLAEKAKSAAQWLIHKAEQEGGYHCLNRLPKEAYCPGLFQGVSGIGYTFLRLVDKHLPQVLLLE